MKKNEIVHIDEKKGRAKKKFYKMTYSDGPFKQINFTLLCARDLWCGK